MFQYLSDLHFFAPYFLAIVIVFLLACYLLWE